MTERLRMRFWYSLFQKQKAIVAPYKTELERLLKDNGSMRLQLFTSSAEIKQDYEKLKSICKSEQCFDDSPLLQNVCGAIKYAEAGEIT